MKHTIKNCIFCITTIFFILTIFMGIYEYNNHQKEIEKLDLPLDYEQTILHDETISFQEGMTFIKSSKLTYLNGRVGLVFSIMEITVISCILGSLIGLAISIKEYSKVKYILYYILGNIFYNLLVTVAIQIIYPNNTSSFVLTYYNSFIKTILLYSCIYFIFVGVKFVNNNQKVKQLNNELNNNSSKNI